MCDVSCDHTACLADSDGLSKFFEGFSKMWSCVFASFTLGTAIKTLQSAK